MLTNEFGFSIGDIHSSNFNIKVVDIKRNILPEISENLLNIPARKGSYFTGMNVQHKVIQIDINIVASSHAERLDYIRKIAYWLLDTKADQEIIFDDENDRAYYGHVANSIQVARGLYNGKATIEIHCSDPFAYGTSDTTLSADSTGLFTVDNSGSAEIFPILTTNFANDASSITYIAPQGIIQVGTPASVEKTNVPAKQVILNDNMMDASSWTDAGSSLLDQQRVDTGSIVQLSDGIGCSDFGTGANLWHGAAIRKNLPSAVQDFEVKAQIKMSSQNNTSSWDGSQMGRIEIYLYDVNNTKIGKMVMADGLAAYEFNVPQFQMGTGFDNLLVVSPSIPAPTTIQQKSPVYYTVQKGDNLSSIAWRNNLKLSDLEAMNGISPSNTTIYPGQKLKIKDGTKTQTIYPSSIGDYNDFYGQLTIQRVGTTWFAYVMRLDNRFRPCLQRKFYYDTEKKYPQTELAYIVIHFSAYDTHTPVKVMEVNNLQVNQINSIDSSTHNQTIFHSGDELVVDCTDSSVRLNGELIKDKLDIGSTFFPIEPGTSEVKVLCDDSGATHKLTYTPRFL